MAAQSIENIKRINLGTSDIGMSAGMQRKFSYFIGVFFLIPAIYFAAKNEVRLFDIGMSAIYFINAGFFLVQAHITLSSTSKFAPHFIVSDIGLQIKNGVFKKSKVINLDEIKKIELGYYKIGIKDKTDLKFYPYKTRKETSVQIKRAIQEIAAQKGVEVENLLKR